MDFNQQNCDIAGIAYPVYCFGLPNIVMNFFENVLFSKECYIFGLASYGALLTSSGKILKKKLSERGYKLSAGFAINMPGNAQAVYDVPKDDKVKNMYQKAQSKIEEISAIIDNRQSYKVQTNLGLIGRLMSKMSVGMMSTIHTTAKSFKVEDSCDSCKICVNVCPVRNVAMNNEKPAWGDKCEGCMACFHWCPKAAIQANEKTIKRGRYHHSKIELKEML